MTSALDFRALYLLTVDQSSSRLGVLHGVLAELGSMIQLVYISAARFEMSADDLHALLAKARENNHRLDVTGMLLYHERSFIQALEGDEATVMGLYEKIARDPRHSSIEILLKLRIEQRNFGQWRMGFFNADSSQQPAGFSDLFGEHFSRRLFSLEPSLARRLLLGFCDGAWRQHVETSEETEWELAATSGCVS